MPQNMIETDPRQQQDNLLVVNLTATWSRPDLLEPSIIAWWNSTKIGSHKPSKFLSPTFTNFKASTVRNTTAVAPLLRTFQNPHSSKSLQTWGPRQQRHRLCVQTWRNLDVVQGYKFDLIIFTLPSFTFNTDDDKWQKWQSSVFTKYLELMKWASVMWCPSDTGIKCGTVTLTCNTGTDNLTYVTKQ
jgi:hypothetical protein